MADGSQLLIFRSFTTDELLKKKKELVKRMTTISSMTTGQKSFTRDIRMLRDQLEAVVFVLTERGNPSARESYMVTDFSCLGSAPPAGNSETLSY